MDTMTIWLISVTAITVAMSLVVWLIVICNGRVMARINTMYDKLSGEVNSCSKGTRFLDEEERSDRHLLTEDIYFDLDTVNTLLLKGLGCDAEVMHRLCAGMLLSALATDDTFWAVRYTENSNELHIQDAKGSASFALTPARRLLLICLKIMCVKDKTPIYQRWAINDFDIALKLYKTDFLFCQIVDAGDDGLKRVLNNAISCHCEKATSHC